jgi:soluble lytic murein transglycosylase-like protein
MASPRTDYRRRARRRSRGRAIVALVVLISLVGTAAIGGWLALTSSPAKRVLVDPTDVPADLRPVLIKAAKRCDAIPVEILAAQIAAESRWDPNAVSPVGARGIAQFMPEVWEQYGIDADKDGTADIWNPVDAIHSAAALNCINRKLVRGASGNRLINTLAAYNAGFGSVLKYDGLPPFPETEAYVARILEYAKAIRLPATTEA